MKRLKSKLGFVHRRLWERDGRYRAAMLFGPAPLLGCLVGAIAWAGLGNPFHAEHPLPPWGAAQRPQLWDTKGGNRAQPEKPLPPATAAGGWEGYTSGWQVAAQPIEISQTLEVDVKPARLNGTISTRPDADMADLIAHGPKDMLFVYVGLGSLVVPTAGDYAIAARMERPAAASAACLVRLGFAQHRIVSSLGVSIETDTSRTFGPAHFALEPGLYSISWAFGCWRGQHMIGPGRMTLLIQHPDEETLQPARPDEIVHMALTQREPAQ